ncbi:MAG: NAD-dependent epimerase/dehydratase family protein [Verrucomicrobiota bacterium]|nr:NAD-dependent epimerase/dehydratase family protein [Verrucomicrobiota bacterium]
MSATVLVTGGAGFIGSHVTDELLKAGRAVVVLDDLSGGLRENLSKKAEFVEGSILNETLVKDLFERYHFDYVFHLAAYAAEGLSHFIKRFNYENNLIGSINLINASINHEVKCFVFTSSIAVYGRNKVPMLEEMTPIPEDSYGIAKLAVEQELRICQEMFGLNYIVFRPHNIYGERQNLGDRYRNVVGIFINQALQGKPLTVFGDGNQTRAFSYIKEVAPIIASSIDVEKAYNQVFNIGADKVHSINELVREVSEAMGVEIEVTYLDERNEVKDAYCCHDKAHATFQSARPYSLKEGLQHMVDWARLTGSREMKQFADIEVRQKLPASWSS